jgi:hypothetical protein
VPHAHTCAPFAAAASVCSLVGSTVGSIVNSVFFVLGFFLDLVQRRLPATCGCQLHAVASYMRSPEIKRPSCVHSIRARVTKTKLLRSNAHVTKVRPRRSNRVGVCALAQKPNLHKLFCADRYQLCNQRQHWTVYYVCTTNVLSML